MKKINYLMTFSLILIVIIISSCNNSDNPPVDGKVTKLLLDQEKTIGIEQCDSRDLTGKYIMIESTYCPHCANVKPILEEISKEQNINFIFLNTAEDRNELDNYGIEIKYTPTLIFNCQVIIGERDKSYYEQFIK